MDQLARINSTLKRTEALRDFSNMVRLLAKHAGGNRDALAADLRTVSSRVKSAIEAGTVGESTWADDVAYQQLTNEFMSLLSANTIAGRVPFRRVGLNTRTLKETSPGSAAWVGEGAGIPVSAFSLDVVQLPPQKDCRTGHFYQ